MDLLATYTHHSELQAITALSLISTLQITTALAKPFSGQLCLHQPFPGNSI
jgi:hypothetical protein